MFYYEIMNDQEKATNMAKKTFDEAISNLDDMKEEEYKHAALILQLLRDNITIWTSNEEEDEGAKGELCQQLLHFIFLVLAIGVGVRVPSRISFIKDIYWKPAPI